MNLILQGGCAYLLLSEVVTVPDGHFSAFCIEERSGPFNVVNVDSLFYYKAIMTFFNGFWLI